MGGQINYFPTCWLAGQQHFGINTGLFENGVQWVCFGLADAPGSMRLTVPVLSSIMLLNFSTTEEQDAYR